jgi:hypothetical protein
VALPPFSVVIPIPPICIWPTPWLQVQDFAMSMPFVCWLKKDQFAFVILSLLARGLTAMPTESLNSLVKVDIRFLELFMLVVSQLVPKSNEHSWLRFEAKQRKFTNTHSRLIS